jgi:hypothetical protein
MNNNKQQACCNNMQNKMNHYQLIARSDKFLYLDIKGRLSSIHLNHSESHISNTFYDLPYVKNEDEAQELLDLKNECELNSLVFQS